MVKNTNEVRQDCVQPVISVGGTKHVINKNYLITFMNMQKEIKNNAVNGSTTGNSETDYAHQENSKNSKKPTSSLKKQWHTPEELKELAKQAVEVGTMILNDDIEIEKARAYSAVVKVTTQAITAEINKARLAGYVPDIDLK